MVWKFALILILISSAYFFFSSSQRLPDLLVPVKTADISYTPSKLSIENIFSRDHTWTATLSAKAIRTIIATGDIIPARSVNFKTLQLKDFRWPYLNTADFIKSSDITFINLETPLIDHCPVTQEGMVFCGDLRNVAGLVFAGVDIANLANNHSANFGPEAVKTTTQLLHSSGILTTGIDGPTVKEVRGIKFAFLGFNDISKPQPGITNVDENLIKSQISDAKKYADIVIAAFHWGTEYKGQPDKRQQQLGRLAVDAGADLIIGNHPHWIQPVEIYHGKLITYAHGNFIFDQMWSQKTKEGVIGRYTFYDKKLVDVEYFPLQIENFGQPYFLKGAKKESILDDMEKQSLLLQESVN